MKTSFLLQMRSPGKIFLGDVYYGILKSWHHALRAPLYCPKIFPILRLPKSAQNQQITQTLNKPWRNCRFTIRRGPHCICSFEYWKLLTYAKDGAWREGIPDWESWHSPSWQIPMSCNTALKCRCCLDGRWTYKGCGEPAILTCTCAIHE